MTNIVKLIEKAQGDFCEISDILDNMTKDQVSELKPIIPALMKHKSWFVRDSILEVIGRFELKDYTDLVEELLEDINIYVRSSALVAYYDLLKDKAIARIKQYSNAKSVRVRLKALILIYIETENDEIFKKIEKIVTRKNCHYYQQYVMKNTFEAYLNIKTFPEIISLYKKMLQIIPKDYGIAKDLTKKLVEINAI